MKKYVIGITLFMLLFSVSSMVVLAAAEKNDAIDIKKWIAKEYYVQITENRKEEPVEDHDEKKQPIYWYTMKSYDKKGNEETVKFFATKNLKVGAVLRVYVSGKYPDKTNGIESYEEIKANEVPGKAKEKLGVK
ncbi:conserved hypothetical protein TIGR01655 [Bacillus sp. 491mf]|uniref:YxeA family protein n=1 Tax=Bacillus sp. 491mf TaxID=1761755 RepID=UPI0008E4AE78|nr:YxeA family protein [Bacillus sp. 491mf]SFD33389.1 conserved hypothetical protein TIGR01655 [Bacillus sp. 491mf]